jgi:glycosyltransferase involved in cell wall biosynthesis
MNPLRVLYVGRLSAAKNVNVLISAIATLRAEGVPLRCVIVGEGPRRPALEAQVSSLNLSDCVSFAGGVDFARVLDFYEEAEVLVLASETEGWPKAITEGMAFGLICIGSDRGLVPEILGDGRGIVVPPGDSSALTTAIRKIAEAPQDFQTMRTRAADWTKKHSLESLQLALKELLAHWEPQSLPTLLP